MNIKYHLYSSEGCHLCEQALLLCQPFIASNELAVIDIVEDEKLVALYGVHIPVLERLSDQQKLFWPFQATQVKELV